MYHTMYRLLLRPVALGQEKLELIIDNNSNLKSGSRRFIYLVRISTPEYITHRADNHAAEI